METYESEHYLFHYGKGTAAERDILCIAETQEACFRYICMVLGVKPDFKIVYFLCDSPEEVGRIYGDNDPCNGFAKMPDTIYAVYNDAVKCIGFHEDAHILSYLINRPDSPAIREGLAMYFDRKWWGIQNLDWCGFYLETGRYRSVAELMQKEVFFELDCAITYPIMGAFTDYLMAAYGKSAYITCYQKLDVVNAMREVLGKTPEELNAEFVSYVKLFRIEDALKRRMIELLTKENL